METQTKPATRRPVLIWLIVSQIMAAASLVFWLLVAGLSVMAFDSGVSIEAWTIVIIVGNAWFMYQLQTHPPF